VGADQGLTRLFYDGGCGFCNGAARFVARQDPSGEIRFAPLGGVTFDRLIPLAKRSGLPDSLLVLTPEGELLLRSRAVIHLLGRMGPWGRLAGALLAWIPTRLCDAAYDWVARLRPTGQTCTAASGPRDERFES
jgi:predicted DCC family thiol-disulfide oxidoreductase YuxK